MSIEAKKGETSDHPSRRQRLRPHRTQSSTGPWRHRQAEGKSTDIEIVAVNDLTDNASLAHLLKFDSILGRYPEDISLEGDDTIVVGSTKIKALEVKEGPAALPWGDLGVDVVVESTGIFTDAAKAKGHLDAGAKKVIISAPAKGEDSPSCSA